ncbi:MAG TPA: hypothetical protein VGS14_06910 [Actinomycetes bacterium]|jgi:hypothetical protein|nr:hypothetical protein [Actinomycetes bacterium]
MGTSTDRTEGRGGPWTPLKYAASAYVRGRGGDGDRDRAMRVLARHVPVLGGAAGATASARAGRGGLQRLGTLLASIHDRGLGPTLDQLGLAALVGLSRFDVLDELVTLIAGDGDDLDAQAARDAACDVLDQLFQGADTWDELAASTVSADELHGLLEAFLAHYVYNRVPVIAERLSRLADPEAMRRADAQLRQIVEDVVVIRLPDDPFAVDWSGPEGAAIAADAIRGVYETLEALEGGQP